MCIIGILLLIVGVAGCIYGYILNNSWEAQLVSLLEYGYLDPGTIFIIIGVLCAVLGVVFIILGVTKKKDDTEFLLICSECGSDIISKNKYCKKCKECNGGLVYSGLTKTEWISLPKDERMTVRNRIMTKTREKTVKESGAHSTHCTKCGREISLNAKFCPHCGHDSTNAMPKEKSTDKSEGAKKHACSHCGKMISETAAFCPYCGNDPRKVIAPVPAENDRIQVVSEASTYCPHCGNSIKASAAFCPYCSKDIRRKSRESELTISPPKRSDDKERSFEKKINTVDEIPVESKREAIERATNPEVEETAITDVGEETAAEDAYRGKHVYRGKHLRADDAEKMEEVVLNEEAETEKGTASKMTESLAEHLEETAEKPVAVAPKKKGLLPPSDLD